MYESLRIEIVVFSSNIHSIFEKSDCLLILLSTLSSYMQELLHPVGILSLVVTLRVEINQQNKLFINNLGFFHFGMNEGKIVI